MAEMCLRRESRIDGNRLMLQLVNHNCSDFLFTPKTKDVHLHHVLGNNHHVKKLSAFMIHVDSRTLILFHINKNAPMTKG